MNITIDNNTLELDEIIAELDSEIEEVPFLHNYLTVILMANTKAIKEMMKTREGKVTTMQLLKQAGWIAKWEAVGEERKALAIAQNMINLGIPLETVVSTTQLDLKKIKALYP